MIRRSQRIDGIVLEIVRRLDGGERIAEFVDGRVEPAPVEDCVYLTTARFGHAVAYRDDDAIVVERKSSGRAASDG
ncbi:MAG TPA: hypothetical protein VFA59_17165 [Vicinamibacterales bacterium]|nr:hypothetical protein [Vicinamibacterales bacterium]